MYRLTHMYIHTHTTDNKIDILPFLDLPPVYFSLLLQPIKNLIQQRYSLTIMTIHKTFQKVGTSLILCTEEPTE